MSKSILIVLISCLFVILNVSSSCFAQSNKTDIELTFTKANDSIKTSNLYFNVLKIWNNTTKPITGNLSFSCPENWKAISFLTDQTTVVPGDTLYMPLRVSPLSNAIGGISYIINATFHTSKHIFSTNTYLTLPQNAKWDFSIEKTSIYFTETNPNTTFIVKLSNKGNTNELIKLNLQAGKLLSFVNGSSNKTTEFVSLPAFKDTILIKDVTYRKDLSYTERLKYEANWKETSISVAASADNINKTGSIQIHKLYSNYSNLREQSSSPLNINYQLYNLMSNQDLSHNLGFFGSLLFSRNREFQYNIGLQNIGFANNGLNKFDSDRQLIYTLNYVDNINNIEIGYNVGTGMLHSLNGRGIVGDVKLGKVSQLNYALIQNQYSNTFGGVVGLSTSIFHIPITTEIVHEVNTSTKYSANSVLFGTGFRFLKYHAFNFQLLTSQTNFRNINNVASKDTSLIGYSYKADYSFRHKRFDFHANTMNSKYNYIMNAGLEQLNIDSRFRLNTKISFSLYANRQSYTSTHFPYSFDKPANYTITDNVRLSTSINAGSLIFMFGPNYNGSTRQSVNTLNGYNTIYKTYQPGIWASTTIRLGTNQSLTPNCTVSNIRFHYQTNDPTGQNYYNNQNIFYSVGLNFFDEVWRVNAYYSSGSVSDLYRSVLIDNKPSVSSSIQFRPSYENYFFDRKVKISVSMNYAYYMPSGRENTSYSLKYDQYLKGGWNISVTGFMYTNTRVDDEKGRISAKDLNFVIGLRKSFNIQQPRQKYYNFKSVFFNDLDGNRIKTKDEPPVANVLVNIDKDQKLSPGRGTIPVINLISNLNGEVTVENLPKDNYTLSFNPLQNLQSLYFLNGSEQSYYNDKDKTFYIPLVESYKIKGKIILVRDPNSTEGKIDLVGVRITATSLNGDTYSVLTDNFGGFIVSVPKADKYNVHVNNVFGEQFSINANEILVQFTQNKTLNVDFTFIENKREIQFGNGGELFNFSSFGTSSDTLSKKTAPETPTQTLAEPTATVSSTNQRTITGLNGNGNGNASTYSLLLSSVKTYVNPDFFKKKYKLKGEVFYTEDNGVYRYYTGNYTNRKTAATAIAKLGLTAAIPMLVDRMLLLSGVPEGTNIAAGNSGTVSNINANPGVAGYAGVTSLQPSNKTNQPAASVGVPTSSTIMNARSTLKKTKEKPVAGATGNKQNNDASRHSSQNTIKDSIPSTVSEGTRQPTTIRPTTTDTQLDPLKDKPEHKTYLYTIKLDASRVFRNPKYYKAKYFLPFDVNCVDKGGVLVYYAGKYETIDAAKAAIARYGISGYIVPIEDQILKK